MKPKIFTYTAYRLPTQEELKDINDCNLSVDEIFKGFKYIIIGRGILDNQHKADIIKASQLLVDAYPENSDYKKVLEKAKNITGRFIKEKIVTETTKNAKILIKRLLRENLSGHSKRKRYINEGVITGKTIINVDIQPEYESAINFNISDWVNFINQSAKSNRIIFLYNGEETMGMVNEIDFKMWLMDLGIEEDVIDSSRFYDKGYAFFRYCMDSGIDENNVADLVRFMSNHKINDSREINDEMWNKYMEETNHDQADVRELLENADDMISIPDLMEFLNNFNNIVLTGGGINECFKEVEIALLALNKPFNTLSQFTY